MKQKKIKLHFIKVKSFVTDLQQDQKETVKGGGITVPTDFLIETFKTYNVEECAKNSDLGICPTKPPVCIHGGNR